MSVLDNFTEEMLQSGLPKDVLITKLLHGLDEEKPPRFEVPVKNILMKVIYTVLYMIIRKAP